MNTNALFTHLMRMMAAFKETMDAGLTRIEITYYADSKEAERQLLSEEYPEQIHADLDQAFAALN